MVFVIASVTLDSDQDKFSGVCDSISYISSD